MGVLFLPFDLEDIYLRLYIFDCQRTDRKNKGKPEPSSILSKALLGLFLSVKSATL
ncbi:hypothetical protein SERLADRAFT_381030, partial [Serpula lacrymans var. lacrymans S7.9]